MTEELLHRGNLRWLTLGIAAQVAMHPNAQALDRYLVLLSVLLLLFLVAEERPA